MTDPKDAPAAGQPAPATAPADPGAAPQGAHGATPGGEAGEPSKPSDTPTTEVPPPPPPPPVEATRMVKPAVREKKIRARQAGQGRLVVKRPNIPTAELVLTRPRTIIGRDRDNCDVVVEEESVSRQHASVTREETGFYTLHDLGSRNGVYVQGRKADRRTLLNGDVFVIGDTTFTFEEIGGGRPPQEPAKAPADQPVAPPETDPNKNPSG